MVSIRNFFRRASHILRKTDVESKFTDGALVIRIVDKGKTFQVSENWERITIEGAMKKKIDKTQTPIKPFKRSSASDSLGLSIPAEIDDKFKQNAYEIIIPLIERDGRKSLFFRGVLNDGVEVKEQHGK